MKKSRFALALCLAALLVSVPAKKFLIGTRPLKDLSAAEISMIQVGLYPPDEEFDLTREEIETLVPLLREVVTYRRDDSYTEYCGQGVVFTISRIDGTQVVLNAYNPFVIIDGTGWRTKYAPCQALSRFGNDLRRS